MRHELDIYPPIQGKQISIKSWCDRLEEGALLQAYNLALHPTTVFHVALMPDCHQGIGMPIGGVIACKDAVIPNAVGVDIGCGMAFIRTGVDVSAVKGVSTPNGELIHTIMHTIERNIPVGFAHHKAPQESPLLDNPPENVQHIGIVLDQLERGYYQMGTLGGGNHFIECQQDEDGNLCIMLHSGSRNFGYNIAKYFNDVASTLCAKWHSHIRKVPNSKEADLFFLPTDSQEGQDYIDAMNFALQFASENRRLMMERSKNILFNLIEKHVGIKTPVLEEVNIHHNFASLENHFGKNVWIHRKGATQARKGQMGIIPGSMGTSSYIVRGLGDRDSFESCSHGAGRIMGRKEFCRTHDIEECKKSMEGIVFSGWGKDRKGNPDFSEAPQAYKDIDEVIASETDLVEVIHKLRPLGVVKG